MKRPLFLLAAVIVVSGCAGSGAYPPASPASSSAAAALAIATPAASSLVLLDEVGRTILGQKVQYPTEGAAQVSSSIVTIPVGGATGRHRHNTAMYAYVLSGRLQVDYDNGTTVDLTAGEAFMEAVNTVHNGRNVGDEDARILVVNMGAAGVVNTEKAP